ncbi:MAG: AAA family ATPase, partial [Prevotella sp.]|nr:AAA family ATPase [Prevotella sp.]
DIIENPYILYEKTRLLEENYRFGIGQIDLAMFPDKIIKDAYHIKKPSLVRNADDKRRLRAIITSILENAAAHGSTVVLLENLTEQVNNFRSDVEALDTKILQQTIIAIDESGFFEDVVTKQAVKIIGEDAEKDSISYKLYRLVKIDTKIKEFVNMRLQSKLDISDEWEKILDSVLKEQKQSGSEHEKLSRTEKVEAIKKMAQARISVLTGGAGTGKTTTLVALCKSEHIRNEGILVLAPTGKARVVLSQKLTEKDIREHNAFTLFQYLRKTQHCDHHTWSYYLSGRQDDAVPQTVIIDECSMLTEEMFGALAEAVFFAKRVIFVGDPNQLPPIGSGKPFFELVSSLNSMEGQPFFAELKISNRQKKSSQNDERLDIELAKLFTENQQKEAGEDIFDRIAQDNENIEFRRFDNVSEIQSLVFNTIVNATEMVDESDIDGFDVSLGGANNGEWMNLNHANNIEDWQIISPYRNDSVSGSLTLNRYIHEKYRQNKILPGQKFKKRVTRHPLGSDAIRYGDKVINIRNQDRSLCMQGYPKEGCENYIANGEIGIVSFLWEKPKAKQNTHQIIFSSQKDYNYNFFSIITDGESDLELAYVLTVHKVQGSGFLKTIFIINEPENGMNSFLSRELIYTALTRQSDKVYILYNKDPSEIKKYSDSYQSDLGRRLTNLFSDTVIREFEGGWYDNGLIHVTTKGEKVRSKSEVIIANELYHADIKYVYEKELPLSDGTKWHPDFTLRLKNGEEIYWEHLGMLGNRNYNNRWEYKKEIYAKNGITESNGKLITTQDDVYGGFNSIKVKKIIANLVFVKESAHAKI